MREKAKLGPFQPVELHRCCAAQFPKTAAQLASQKNRFIAIAIGRSGRSGRDTGFATER